MGSYDPLTLAGVIEQWASAKPDLAVLVVEGAGVREDERRTYADLWENGRRLAAGLRQLGLAPGDMVGTLLANHVEFVDLMVAGSLLGIVLVPIDPRTRGDKLVFMLANARCKGVVAGDYALPELRRVREQVAGLRWIVGLPTDEGRATAAQLQAAGVRPYGELAGVDLPVDPLPGSDPDRPMELIYTSGTTGDPKGIVLTHRRYCETSRIAPFLFGFRQIGRAHV